MTRAEVIAVLAVAAKAYGREIDAQTIDAWLEFMTDIAANEAARALREHVRESKFFPTIAEITTRVAAARIDAPDIAQAWGEVQRALVAVGRYGSPKFSHPLIAQTVNALGWQSICDSPVETEATLRAQFERFFRARADSAHREANAGALDVARTGSVSSAVAIRGLLGEGPR